jgi:3-methyladenine DNA glycosylase AlkD
MLIDDAILEISALQNSDVKNSYLRFFKAKSVDEREFLGIKIPFVRKLAKKYYKILELHEIETILQSRYHEIRYFALSCLVLRVQTVFEEEKITKIYLENLKYINNWDLIDISAPYILKNLEPKVIWLLAKSENLWNRRCAILSQLAKIRNGDVALFLELAEFLIDDKEDLIQKPIGWLLREVGKVCLEDLENFLNKNAKNMNRVALRYAIEKFDKEKRAKYLKIKKV